MEYNSFYYAMRLTIDMLDLYKEEIGYNQQEWLKFFGRSEMIYSTYIEYKLYMMEYLRIVKNNYPSIYEQIITNVQFKKAFFEIDVNWMIALKEYDLFKKQIFSYLENNGLSVKETNKSIQIQNMAINNSKLQLDRMNKYLDSDVFNEIFNDLNYKEKARHY
jgi:aspartokinase